MEPIKIECANPILNVRDMAISRDYYINVLGFTECDWGKGQPFTCMVRDGAGIYLCENGQGRAGTWVWIGFDGDIQVFHDELKQKGAIIRMPPTSYPWARENAYRRP